MTDELETELQDIEGMFVDDSAVFKFDIRTGMKAEELPNYLDRVRYRFEQWDTDEWSVFDEDEMSGFKAVVDGDTVKVNSQGQLSKRVVRSFYKNLDSEVGVMEVDMDMKET